MADDLQALETWVGPLLAKLTRSEVRRLAAEIARDLRRSQQQRIAAQQNADGSPYEPRKPQHTRLRDQAGALRRGAMFQRLRMAKFLRATTDAEGAVVAFLGRAARIAAVHQYGEIDQVQPGGPSVRYPVRELLGLSAADIEHVREQLLNHLAG